ncbi:TPA: non-canonical purine NTP pyrophosphatase, RdgB/HAM1 family [candidate division CPR2 bacterium]|uniref:Ham1 family protein n=1 Tax=candidate division CPR2 bacterium GW2011_GWC1_41_48 TaxID=1618344 RepID=A0A0G0WCH4_UNCC2|nr:MAG: Ham1 family protein [candidate division CPR2 bacterium GW2011_GWC2_39_35]KKR28562.1 MAG: Ham1 family protein [candidate division CPR2 bacterium GW2011_GWD1_39_7]KKR29417.1 MAG: Ham1 family protein [candidate division CPR2 bacterium GW2011_GWD2_39_7]KKS09752.1 MAG: Ham1 family protein [candidate division CPR2 bacterium GW2011_GWC1_41_48]OGB61008.1 MAG: non-canonical purine NTP pyrophosphatase, RdgB/HAM1 family [candidate division CPR2 bacterium GWD1_39_7]OGB71239.1 MAG: non-canonical pu
MLYFITGNENKFREVKSILGGVEQLDVDLSEIQEIDAKVIINSKLKEALKHREGDFIVEDTSLYLDALNGLPGPLIKWFLKTTGNDGLAKIALSLGNNNAEAKTIIGYVEKSGAVSFFEGAVKGRIVEPRGDSSFGWDPIFIPDGYNKTFSEMSEEEKNSISMRRIALNKLKEYLSV